MFLSELNVGKYSWISWWSLTLACNSFTENSCSFGTFTIFTSEFLNAYYKGSTIQPKKKERTKSKETKRNQIYAHCACFASAWVGGLVESLNVN